MTEIIQPIPARLKNIASQGHVAGADQIIDDSLGKVQSDVNQDQMGLAIVISIAQVSNVSTISQATSPEWKYVLLDYDEKVLCGIKQDGLSYLYATIEEIMDCINSSYV